MPIVFVAIDGLVYSPIDGKPKRTRSLQRVRNIERQSASSLLLDHYDSDWNALWWLRIDTVADVVDATTVTLEHLERVTIGLRAKYPQYRAVPLFQGEPSLLRLRCLAHRAWSAVPMHWGEVHWREVHWGEVR